MNERRIQDGPNFLKLAAAAEANKALREIAGRIKSLSYSDMKILVTTLEANGIRSVTIGSDGRGNDIADALLKAAADLEGAK